MICILENQVMLTTFYVEIYLKFEHYSPTDPLFYPMGYLRLYLIRTFNEWNFGRMPDQLNISIRWKNHHVVLMANFLSHFIKDSQNEMVKLELLDQDPILKI